MKAASKNEMYTGGLPYCMIFLREIGPEVNGTNFDRVFLEELEQDASDYLHEERRVVHVYKGRRHLEPAPQIEKFRGAGEMWVAQVEKVREEKLMTRSNVLRF